MGFWRDYDAGAWARRGGLEMRMGDSVVEEAVVDTSSLLEAVDVFDTMRPDVSDTDGFTPPRFRSELLRLHQLAMEAFPDGIVYPANPGGEMLELAEELESVAWELHENAKRLWGILDAFSLAAAPHDDEQEGDLDAANGPDLFGA